MGIPRPSVEEVCNTLPCIVYKLDISAFSQCSKSCGGGTQTRTVNCKQSDGAVVAASVCAGAALVRTETACNTQGCEVCQGEISKCSGHGQCESDVCTCAPDFKGVLCGTPVSCNGVIAADGTCCPGVLQADGTCCSGPIDACGVCNGRATAVDILGTCCSGVVGESGLCCASSNFDSCGVCDGDGSSCNVKFEIACPGVDATQYTDVDTVVANPTQFIADVRPDVHSMLGLPAPSACSGCVDIAVSKAESRRLLVTRRLAAGDLKMDVTINQNKIIDAGEAPVTAIVVQERQA